MYNGKRLTKYESYLSVSHDTLFNNNFSSVFTVEDNIFTPTVDSADCSPAVDSINFNPGVVFGKLMDLQSGKSPSPDGWPIQIIKSVGEFIAIPLSIIFNKSFSSSTLLLDWKSAHVTSIHKKRAKKILF